MRSTAEVQRSRLRSMGIGCSLDAIESRRSMERARRLRAINEGEELPGWVGTSLGTPENVESFLDSLTSGVREKAEELLKTFYH